MEGMRTADQEVEWTEGGKGYRQDGDKDGLSRWEDNLAHATLGMDPNDPLAYAPGLELHQPIMSTIGETRGRLERERGIM